MPEYPIPHLAEKFLTVFEGLQTIHGISNMTGVVGSDGKREASSFAVHTQVTKELWEQHLRGSKSIGQFPLAPDGTIRWAAIDADIYDGSLQVPGFLERINTLNLPMILCRSKSGGAHLLIFFSERVRMEEVREKIEEFATFFQIGGQEIFPKQDRIGDLANGDVAYGNWLNMPYNGLTPNRYGWKTATEPLTASEFIDKIESIAVTKEQFLGIALPRPPQTLEDGPPCLNYLVENKMDMKRGRNTLLFNLATFFKKQDPEATKEALLEFLNGWNQKFREPLEEKEIKATVLKSTSKRSYHYQCGNDVLKRHCNSNICKTCLFGIDGDEDAFDPNNKSLIQLQTDPPLYFIDYKKKQLRLTRDEFWSYEQVRKAAMEQARHIPPKMDQEHWLNLVQGYLESVTVVEMPPETTAAGQIVEILQHWRKRASYDPEDLFNGMPLLNKKEDMLFRNQDFRSLLKMEQFRALPDNRVTEFLKNGLLAENVVAKAGTKSIRVWKIARKDLQNASDLCLKEPMEPEEHF
jgi:hypothetical protein